MHQAGRAGSVDDDVGGFLILLVDRHAVADAVGGPSGERDEEAGAVELEVDLVLEAEADGPAEPLDAELDAVGGVARLVGDLELGDERHLDGHVTGVGRFQQPVARRVAEHLIGLHGTQRRQCGR